MQTCLSQAKQQINHEFNLATDCPALFHELQSQHLLATLEAPDPAKLGLEQLEFLANSSQRLRHSELISQEGLDQLLTEILKKEINDPKSEWWKAFLGWLDGLNSQEYEPHYQWLIALLEKIKPSAQSVKYFFYATIALLLIMAAWLVFNELYRSGFFIKFSGKRQPLTQGRHSQNLPPITSPPVIRELPPKRQIAALLEQVIDMLAERELIPNDLSLTHRQILRYLNKHNNTPDSPFAHLLQEAEPILYGNRVVDTQMLGDYQRNVQMLLGRPDL